MNRSHFIRKGLFLSLGLMLLLSSATQADSGTAERLAHWRFERVVHRDGSLDPAKPLKSRLPVSIQCPMNKETQDDAIHAPMLRRLSRSYVLRLLPSV